MDITTTNDLVSKIREANEAYRLGNPIMSDPEWDALIEELHQQDPTHELLQEIGYIAPDDSRKEALPFPMMSMNKVKTPEEVDKWITKYGLQNEEFILTPKFDGCSLCVNEVAQLAWTRGDGTHGQRSHEHFKAMKDTHLKENIFTYGEAIMPRARFEEKYAEDEENPRNTVAGIMNKPDVTEKTADVDYVRYGIVLEGLSTSEWFVSKREVIEFLNERQDNEVFWQVVNKASLTTEILKEIFVEWSQKYEIDGIIIEVNNLKRQEELGRERNGNPVFARAYKGDFEEVKETTVTGINWQISKKGLVKPVIQIEPTRLDGATVTNVTGNNAKFMLENGIGIGTKMTVKRSGMVIPKVVEIISATGFDIEQVKSKTGVDVKWNDNHVELVTTEATDEQQVQFLTSFFKILGVDNVSEGTCQMLFDAGFDTVKKILSASQTDFEKIDRFGSRKAEIVYTEIQSKMKDVELSKLQHASGCFENLGSKKLVLLEHLYGNDTIRTSDITSVEGFSDTSADAYLKGVEKYSQFVADLGDLVKVKKTEIKEADSDEMAGNVFVFTGVRRPDLEDIIKSKGGVIASGVSAKITHLVMKEKGSGSSKEVKALELGKEVITVDELEKMLNQ
jgi:NAD-dependent DNA ligase